MATGGDEVVRLGYSWIARNFERVGLPTAGLIVLVSLLSYAARWTALEVVKPWVANHNALVQASIETMKTNAEANRTNAQTNQRVADAFDAVVDEIKRHGEQLDAISRREVR